MKVIVAVYKTHDQALDAIKALGDSKFPMKLVSLIGRAEIIDDQMTVQSFDNVKNAPAFVGSVAGSVVGLLTGLGIFAIPGFGFLYGAGAFIGMIAGFDLGVLSGGIVTLLATYGIKKESLLKYEETLADGNFLVIIRGDLKEVKQAEHILHTEREHLKYQKIFREYLEREPDMKRLKNKEIVYNG